MGRGFQETLEAKNAQNGEKNSGDVRNLNDQGMRMDEVLVLDSR
jgi:hypothetical protein